jgi:PAS domain S-box-containing protein
MTNTKTIEEVEARIEALEKELAYYRATYPSLCKKKSLSEIAIENLPFDVFAIDEDGRYILQNSRCREHWGDFIGKRPEDVTADKSTLSLWKSNNRRCLAGEVIKGEVSFKIGGEEKYFYNIILPFKEDDRVKGIIGVNINIGELKHAKELLREAYDIINKSPAVVFLWRNAEGWPVEYVSENVINLFGYSDEEFVSGEVSYAATVHPDDLARVAKEVLLYSREEGRKEFSHKPYRIITKYGETKWLDDMTFIRRNERGDITHFQGIVLDVSERVNADDKMKKLQAGLHRAQKMESLGLLAGGVAHDLNNVLAGIVTYPELILLELPENSNLRKPVKTIQECGNRAVAIVKDLLTIARGVVTAKTPLNINSVVQEYLSSPEFEKLKQFHPSVMVKANLDPQLLNTNGFHVHIRKVIMNLVSNAVEAIEGTGNVTISTSNRHVDSSPRRYNDTNTGEYAVLAVSDDGSGISSAELERIFEPFYTKKVMGRSGTGLGLSVVWNILEDHNGYIDVISDEKGTIFEAYFPITRQKVKDQAAALPVEDLKGNGESILVVDDMESQREIVCWMLNILGYKAFAVSSGEKAIEYLKEHGTDLVLLDMIMDPGISGRETYEGIIKIHPRQKAVIASGFAETEEVTKTQELGAGQFLKKPLTLEALGVTLKQELGKGSKRRI